MLKGIANAFRVKELRDKILLTIGILVLYRIGAYVPVPGIPFEGMLNQFQTALDGLFRGYDHPSGCQSERPELRGHCDGHTA